MHSYAHVAKDVPKKSVIIPFPVKGGAKPILPDDLNRGNFKDWEIQELKKKVKFYEDLILGRNTE